MSGPFEKIKKTRLFLLALIENLSSAQLNAIPEGFNNNIIWNLGHMLAAQQGICYLRANQKPVVPDKYISAFTTNTKPAADLDDQEIRNIKDMFIDSIDRLAMDYNKGTFRDYTPSPNILRIYNLELKSIDDALEFILYHEGYHCGCIVALQRLVRDQVAS